MTDNKTYIYGKHALTEALTYAPQTVFEVFVAKHFDDSGLLVLIKKSGVKLSVKMPQGFDDTVAHQGVVGLLHLNRLMQSLEDFKKNLKIDTDTSLILLGELQDPQNVGAIIRSASAFGVSGVLIPDHNQAQITGSVVKISAGMAFRIPLVSIGNINTTIRDLKEDGFFVYGLSGEGKHTVTKEAFEMPTLFILGNEAEGLREKTRELCDKILSIPMNPRCESLNAASSATVAMYAWSTKHPKAIQ